MRTHLDYGGRSTWGPMWETLKDIAERDSQYIPEIMDLMHHQNMEEQRIGTRDCPFHNLDYDYVLLTCLKQKPELITQELYNDIKDQNEKFSKWQEDKPPRTTYYVSGASLVPYTTNFGGDKRGEELVPYMESVNPKLKENWQESRRQSTNFKQGVRRGGMGE